MTGNIGASGGEGPSIGVDAYFNGNGGYGIILNGGVSGGVPVEMHGGVCYGKVIPYGNIVEDTAQVVVAIDKAVTEALDATKEAVESAIRGAIDSLLGKQETKSDEGSHGYTGSW